MLSNKQLNKNIRVYFIKEFIKKSSISISLLYFTSPSLLWSPPDLIWVAFAPTAKSAIKIIKN